MVFGFSLHGFEIENTFHNKDLVFKYSITIIIIIIIIVGHSLEPKPKRNEILAQ